MELFGFEIKRASEKSKLLKTFSTEDIEDGSYITFDGGAGNFMGHGLYDLGYASKHDHDLISQYRDIAIQAECDIAIDDIVNEAITYTDTGRIVEIILDDIKQISDPIKSKIRDEFSTIYSLLNFQNSSYEIFRRWYVDGRLAYHIVIDHKKPKLGISSLKYIDPRKLKKIKNIKKMKASDNSSIFSTEVDEYFVYSEEFNNNSNSKTALKVSADSIAYVTSGLMRNEQVVSYLHKAIKPLNQLRILEDSSIIYRVTRAPERRIFYVDVGTLPKAKAEQHLRDMMNKFKNKIVYDSSTGAIKDAKNTMTMTEDFWLPRREGGRGTEIDTLAGGTGLGEIDDILFFQRKLYKSLNVPTSRLDTESTFNVGRTSEITRDEIKFSKFIIRLRNRFSMLFNNILEKQLLLKGIITSQEWDLVKSDIKYNFEDDSHFAELKESEVRRGRFEDASSAEEFIGVYFSRNYIEKKVLKLSEETIAEIQSEIVQEKKDGRIESDLDGDGVDDSVDDDIGGSGEPGSNPPKEDKETNEEQINGAMLKLLHSLNEDI